MNKILNLFNEEYVLELFNKEILPLYPNFKEIKGIKISSPKKYIWETTYHVVIKFKTTFISQENKKRTLSIYCTAHSNETRENAYKSLTYLWNNSFSNSNLTIPRPLLYNKEYQGTFYQGVNGHNLYEFIKKSNFEEIEKVTIKTAKWFAKLHKLPTKSTTTFKKENDHIRTVVPGYEHIIQKIKKSYPHHLDLYEATYKHFMNKEEAFFDSTTKRYLVHGDAHPENVIKVSENKLAVIDFTDLGLGDFARDIGSFTQQLEYMVRKRVDRPGYEKNVSDLFLNNYFKNVNITLDENIQKRIDLYYYWTAIRTASFFLLGHDKRPERAEKLIGQIKEYLETT